MSSTQSYDPRPEALEILLEVKTLHVSFLSVLLRTCQVALREMASERQVAQEYFSRKPQPVLAVSSLIGEDATRLWLYFVDPKEDTPLPELSVETFEAFMEAFGQFLKDMPQRSLWGISSRNRRRSLPSKFLKRLDQVRAHLRRVPRATLTYRQHSITVERNGIEISG